MKIKLKNKEIRKALEIATPSFPKDESGGIDGYVGRIPVSIKPDTYKIKKSLSEEIPVKIIYYKKVKNGIEVDYSEIL